MHVPTGAYAIGGTAALTLRYSIISATAAARTLPPGRLRAGKGCWGWAPPPLPPGPQDLPRDYGPDGAAGGLKPEYTAASGPRTFGSGPTTGTRSQTTCYVRRGTGRVIINDSFEWFLLGQPSAFRTEQRIHSNLLLRVLSSESIVEALNR